MRERRLPTGLSSQALREVSGRLTHQSLTGQEPPLAYSR
jgi:hypothetical protein